MAVMAAGILSLVAAVALFVLTLTGAIDGGYDGPGDVISVGPSPAFFLTPQPTPASLPAPNDSPIASLAIPRYEVVAPVVTRSVDDAGVMETPDGPDEVAWYDFSAKPGFGHNAVFSGHVDYVDHGPAVFWHLKDLVEGDVIEVELDDGTTYQYTVASVQQVAITEADVGEIVGWTPNDIITLITCGGSWNDDEHEYDSRVIVRAIRSYEPAGAPTIVAPGL